MKKKIAIIFGTRPEYLKLKKIIQLIPKKNRDILYTGQHDKLVSKLSFAKKIIISKKSNNRLNNIFHSIIKKIKLSKYSAILVQGDTATTCAAAINAFNCKIKIIYVESGLRSYDMENPYPEECYRQIISRIADINFCPTQISKKNLEKENIKGKNYVVGNTSLDNLIYLKKIKKYTNLVPITLHRRENIPIILDWFKEINKLANKFKKLKFIYFAHPNPFFINKLKKLKNISISKSIEHSKMLNYLVKSKFIITDSGGIQEEGSFFNKKVIVCRKVTERPEGINTGHIKICSNPQNLFQIASTVNKNYKINTKCPYGDGRSAIRIVKILKKEKII